MLDMPRLGMPLSLTPEQCQKMVRDREFKSPSDRNYLIKLDTENILDGMELGAISLTGGNGGVSCKGQQAKIGGKVIEDVMEMDQFSVTVLKERFEASEGKFVAMHTHKELDCSPSGSGCNSGTHAYTWLLPRDLCPYERIQTVSVNQEAGYFVDHTAKLMFKSIGGVVTAPKNCPTGKMIRATHHHKLFLADVSSGWPALLGAEIDISLAIKLSAEYVSFQFTNSENQNMAKIDQIVCDKTKNLVVSDDLFRLYNSTFARLRGDILYIFDCPAKKGNIISSETCINNLKLASGDGYIDPISKTWKAGTSTRSCQTHFPTAFKADGNIWFQAEPHVKAISAPPYQPLMDVQRGSSVTELFASGSGLYTEEEMASWKRSLIEAGFSKDISSTLNYGLCQGDPTCQSEHLYNDGTTFTLTNLIPKVVGELDVWSRFKRWLEEQAAILSLIVLTIEGVKMLTYAVSFCQNLYKEGIWAAMYCLFSCLFPAWPARRRDRAEEPGFHRVPGAPPAEMELGEIGAGSPPRPSFAPGAYPSVRPYVAGGASAPMLPARAH